MSSYLSQSSLCVHEWDHTCGVGPPKARCDAFPEGIPDEISRNKVYHDKPYPGDGGIRFEYFEARKQPNKSKRNEKRVKWARETSNLLKHLSDPTRVEVMWALAEGELHVGAIRDQLDRQSQPAISHHLALLRHGGIVASRRQGKNSLYGLTDTGSVLVALLKQLSPNKLRGKANVS